MFRKIGIDWFIIALFSLVFIAYIYPQAGIERQGYNPSAITGFGIAFIFFFYGVKLRPSTFLQNVKNWKMHAIIQSTIFIVLPLILILCKPFFANQQMWLSMFFLSALPSTVSSSVVMVSIAKGNVPSAVFNASISSLLGLLITPAWMGLFMVTQSIDFNVGEIYGTLLYQLILPIVLGMMCNKLLHSFVQKYAGVFKIADQLVVLFIIYTSFSTSFAHNIFSSISTTSVILLILGCVLLLFVTAILLYKICVDLRFSYEDTITVMFCGSNKSLLHGVVFAKVLFAGSALSGIVLLPIMIYHTTQLISMSVYAQKRARLPQ